MATLQHVVVEVTTARTAREKESAQVLLAAMVQENPHRLPSGLLASFMSLSGKKPALMAKQPALAERSTSTPPAPAATVATEAHAPLSVAKVANNKQPLEPVVAQAASAARPIAPLPAQVVRTMAKATPQARSIRSAVFAAFSFAGKKTMAFNTSAKRTAPKTGQFLSNKAAGLFASPSPSTADVPNTAVVVY